MGSRIDEPLTMTRSSTTYYYNTDGLGNVRQLTNSSGTIVESYDYDPYGKVTIFDSSLTDITSSGSGIGNPYMFTGRRLDEESGIYHYRRRAYDPVIGRFLQRDPLGYYDSMNLFQYALNNPVIFLDPFGLDVIIFDGENVTIYDDDKHPIRSWPAVSGRPGTTKDDQHIKGRGPIPEGSYTLDPNKTDKLNPFDPRDYDWWITGGPYAWGWERVPIDPDEGTNTYGRGGFFVHGGKVPGSAGCVDLTSYADDFFDYFNQNYSEPVPFLVDYGKK